MAFEDDFNQTSISVKGLRLDSVNVPNIWGDVKPQPAHLDVSIHLKDGFNSAASADILDDSTIHYGELAKKLRAACHDQDLDTLGSAYRAAADMAHKRRGGRFIASQISIELVLPKASAYGAALSLRNTTYFGAGGPSHERREFLCTGLRIMTLIGVNAYERRYKQPLIVDLLIEELATSGDSTQEALKRYCPAERELVRIVEETAFETLESLTDHVVKELILVFARSSILAKSVRIRFEKPAAIPFADAPVIEVKRMLP